MYLLDIWRKQLTFLLWVLNVDGLVQYLNMFCTVINKWTLLKSWWLPSAEGKRIQSHFLLNVHTVWTKHATNIGDKLKNISITCPSYLWSPTNACGDVLLAKLSLANIHRHTVTRSSLVWLTKWKRWIFHFTYENVFKHCVKKKNKKTRIKIRKIIEEN